MEVETLAVSVTGLTKRFGDVVALDGIDLDVPTGTIFGLLGPNGAGKTTAVRILATILAPDGGRAAVMGYDVVRHAQAVRRSIGLAGQYAAVDDALTGRENLRIVGRLARLTRHAASARADELLDAFDLAGAADRPVRTYSGGMRRRLDLAAALVQRPPVLFLDEPTTGLDPASRLELWAMIRRLVADGTSVLLTTQYLEEADQLADRVAVIDGGRVIAHDTPARLKSALGSTVIELQLHDPEQAAQAAKLLAGVVDDAEQSGDRLRIPSNDAPSTLVDVLRALDAGAVQPTGLAVREPSLDDVFLTLTGHHAGDADA